MISFWPFRRRKIVDRRILNEDWAVGDLAECLVDPAMWGFDSGDEPRKGAVLRVTRIEDRVASVMDVRAYFLHFEGHACCYECRGFRKIRPEEVPASDAFIAELRDRLQVGEPVG